MRRTIGLLVTLIAAIAGVVALIVGLFTGSILRGIIAFFIAAAWAAALRFGVPPRQVAMGFHIGLGIYSMVAISLLMVLDVSRWTIALDVGLVLLLSHFPLASWYA